MSTYLIWSNEHTSWWGPDGMGYTENIETAGRYPLPEASRYVYLANRGGRREYMVTSPESLVEQTREEVTKLFTKLADPESNS